ncbi:IclR family transcriptional regulator [Peribacillus castrilensis]|uniref:IclR family transcriptional regulator n=1 Tax=Peribacillus frigoritolerans TaxID=450367 RepID=A0AAJ1VEA9_9BACI|nr:IclR family transcriptional regulator [Peribacillus frigoritolerans]MCP1096119.1 IclR family transcriptional regulator [Bacillaceae bacterium OS4b]MDM5284323.1 IclR family transcriptional regulator [Peribacillus frigoritolerans]
MNTKISSTVQRAIKIINYLNETTGPQGIKNISESLNISPPITHRLLTTLKMDGLVFQDADSKKYSLGTVFIDYANKIITDVPFVSIIDPQLIKLRDETQETVGFYMLTNMVRMCVIEHVSNQEISRRAGVGNRIPLQLGSSGRVILAFLSEGLQAQVLNLLPEEERRMLQQQLEIIVNTRYSINEEEITKNVAALSAPVFGAKGKVIGAISISGPVFRWHKESMEQHISLLLKTAEGISKSLY